jgi:hypothetical protein
LVWPLSNAIPPHEIPRLISVYFALFIYWR